MKSALFKNTYREILGTKARFISIMLIVALGVGFFTGIKCTNPSMTAMADKYYQDNKLMDFRLLSNVGFDDDDVKAIGKTDGVSDVMPSYFADVKIDSDGSGNMFRLMSVPKSYEDHDSINDVTVIDGRLPEKSGEIAVENVFFGSQCEIGDTFVFSDKIDDKDTKDSIKRLDYKIVGIVRTPMYISFERGTTTVGNGKLSAFSYILPEDFAFERYTELYVRVKGTENISAFSDEYKSLIDEYTDVLKSKGEERAAVFKSENIDKAQKEIDDNRKKYEEEKEKAEKELSDAKKEIEDGEEEYNEKIAEAEDEIESAESEIASGESDLESAKAEYAQGKKTFDEEIAKARAQLDEGKKEYEKNKAEFDEKAPQMIEGIEQYKEGITYAASQAIGAVLYVIPQEETELIASVSAVLENISYENAQSSISSVQEMLFEAGYQDIADSLYEALSTVETLQGELSALQEQYYSAEAALSAAKSELDAAQAEFDKEKKAGEEKLSSALAQIYSGEAEISSAKAELEEGKSELETQKSDGKKKIEDAKKEYEDAKSEADKKLSDAKCELDDAQTELDKIEDPKWYVFTRDDNPGYSTFIDNCDRVDNVAVVFPLFFLLVAMLVCLTTMTRLIEEKRSEIGTFKALGYSNGKIIMKFLIYSLLAAVLGSILGCAVGIPVLPKAIYACYGIMYDMPDISVKVAYMPLAIGFTAAVVSCVFVAVFVCCKALREKPCSLMRPKAPKKGKRILLERITFIWKRLSFTSKVTQRNLFRYKARFLMTVLGIAGCTALIVAGFGLYDSISDIVDIQFKDLNRYNVTIITEGDKNESIDPLMKAIGYDDRIDGFTPLMMKSVSLSSDKAKMSDDIYLRVVSDTEEFSKFQILRNRTAGEELKIEENKAIISEKLAKLLSVKEGDFVYIDGDENKKVEISGICENYIYNYIYLDTPTGQKIYDKDLKYNVIFANVNDLNDTLESEISSDYLSRDDVTSVSINTTAVKQFSDTISSLKMITFILVFCAGALALVVLYNLTNINLTERRREIATIKVLGFNHSETAAYVYRENIILTIIGTALGLVLGIFLNSFIVLTVEIDTVMFGRSIYAHTFIYAALGTFIFSFIVNLIMYFRIKKIDMIESLKSVE